MGYLFFAKKVEPIKKLVTRYSILSLFNDYLLSKICNHYKITYDKK
jgi:hypothetical protein